MLTRLKKRVQSLFTKEAELIYDIGVTPNRVTAVGLSCAVLASFFYLTWQQNPFYLIVAPILLLFSGFFDILDGIVARIHQETTIFGAFLDSLADRYVDTLIFAALIISGLCGLSGGLAALIGSVLVSYTRAKAESSGVKMEAVGLMERAERMIVLIVASFLTFFWREALYWGVLILAILTNLTVLQRAVYFFKLSRKNEA